MMLFTPGLYRQPVTPVRPVGALARGDIPVLLGYARKGPVGVPVRLHSLGEFEELYGAPLDHGFLWHSVKAFFENGGRTAYVLRVVSKSSRAAQSIRSMPEQVPVDGTRIVWRAQASFPWLMIDPRKLTSSLQADSASWIQTFEEVLRQGGVRAPDPGALGNALVVKVTRTSRVRTETFADPSDAANVSSVLSLAGLEAGTILELTQTGTNGQTVAVIRIPMKIDTARQKIVWSDKLTDAGLNPLMPIRLASVEFDVAVYSDGKLAQSFAGLSPNPDHSRAFAKTLPAACRSVDFTAVVTGADGFELSQDAAESRLKEASWTDATLWPPEGEYVLTGGIDGLDAVSKDDWLAAFEPIKRLADAAMIAGPDIVLPEAGMPPFESAPQAILDCRDLSQPQAGYLTGKVTSSDTSGTETLLAGVSVDIAGPGGVTLTDAAGLFSVSDIGLSLVTVRLRKQGYEPLEFQAQPTPYPSSDPVPISMTPLTFAKVFQSDEVVDLQTAMANPAIVGPYKIALVDPPLAEMRVDQLATWRARLGDNARLGFFAPWLNLPATNRGGALMPAIACPPSGHVAGAFAAAEAASGIHRTGANLQLRYVEGVTLAIDDAVQEGLNPIGINAIRALPGRGIRIFGTRSLSSDPEWRYLTTRRIVDAIEKSLERVLHWMVFEPNNLITRHSVQVSAQILLNSLFRQGILAGTSPEGAYSAKCDLENNHEASRDEGKLVVDIAVAPTQPFEFIYFRLGHEFEAIQVTER